MENFERISDNELKIRINNLKNETSNFKVQDSYVGELHKSFIINRIKQLLYLILLCVTVLYIFWEVFL